MICFSFVHLICRFILLLIRTWNYLIGRRNKNWNFFICLWIFETIWLLFWLFSLNTDFCFWLSIYQLKLRMVVEDFHTVNKYSLTVHHAQFFSWFSQSNEIDFCIFDSLANSSAPTSDVHILKQTDILIDSIINLVIH